MNQHGFATSGHRQRSRDRRALPSAICSREIVEHHEQLIRNLDLEKLTLLNQRGSHY